MAGYTTNALAAVLKVLLPPGTSSLCLALSGGGDSTVLLVGLAELMQAGRLCPVRAMHVDHQLHIDSARWAEHALALARRHQVPCEVVRVTVDKADAEGVEAAARRARYAALRARLDPDEVLLTAHHGEDQLESILLALMRGSGVRGLAGMPAVTRFGAGWHARPLLDFTRDDLRTWAAQRRMTDAGYRWLEDPANTDLRFARSYLRTAVTPRFRERWPQAAQVASRSAAHLAEAAELLDELAKLDCAAAATGPCLRVAALAKLSSARRRNVLRYWLRTLQLPAPSTRKLHALEHDMLAASPDRNPCTAWKGAEVRRHRGLLYGHTPVPAPPPQWQVAWDFREPLTLPAGLGRISLVPTNTPGLKRAMLPGSIDVCFSPRDERIRVRAHPAATGTRTLQKFLQEKSVLPWWRERLPLLRIQDELLAIGDLWTAPAYTASGDALSVVWDGRPPIIAWDGGVDAF